MFEELNRKSFVEKQKIMSRNSKLFNDRNPVLETSTTTGRDSSGSCDKDHTGIDDRHSTRTYSPELDRFFGRNLLLSEFLNAQKSCVFYENLCTGCGYGVFESKGNLCNFCQFVVNGYLEDNNIYENICEKCSDFYSGKECDCCNIVKTRKKQSRPTKILSGIFGTLKKVRSRESNNNKNTKPRKLEIIHNVDGFDNVFKTNETFDLNRICELKRLQSTSDHHIYGKLRKSDDHLMNYSLNESSKNFWSKNSKSDPNLNKITRSQTPGSSVIIDNDNIVNTTNDKKSRTFIQDHVIAWMTSLRTQAFDYCSTPAHDSICNTKSIPSRNFSCCGIAHEFSSAAATWYMQPPPGEEETAWDSLLNTDLDCTQMVDDFKRNLMERQRSKRRAIYLKIEESSSSSPSTTAEPQQLSTIGSIQDTFLQSSRRHGLYEDSEFVSDLLSTFDAFLKRDQSVDVQNPEVIIDSVITVNGNLEQKVSIENDPDVLPKLNSAVYNNNISKEISKCFESDCENQINHLVSYLSTSKSLNRILISYDKLLSGFLNIISKQNFITIEYPQLVNIYQRICQLNRKQNRRTKRNLRAIEGDTESRNSIPMTVQPRDEDIYQPIWKFKTVGNPRESYASDYYDITLPAHESSRVEDHGEWETDDDFTFSRKPQKTTVQNTNEPPTRSVENVNVVLRENNKTKTAAAAKPAPEDPYRSVCILYCPTEPKLRAIIYDYDRRRPFTTSQFQGNAGAGGCVSRSPDPVQVLPQVLTKVKSRSRHYSESNKSALFIPESVQAWKFMLLDTNYIEDEEDMYVSRDEMFKLNHIENETSPGPVTLQRFKSKSIDNLLLDSPDKKSIGERFRNKFQRGVLKLNSRSPKEGKKGKTFLKRSDVSSVCLADGMKPTPPIFGVTLDEVERDPHSCNVPRFVADCIRFIEKRDCIQIDGLYRASGNKVAIDDLKKKLTEFYDSSLLRNQDIHTITGLLKLFFRELQTPLIPNELYKKLPDNLVEISNLTIIKRVLSDIPNPAQATLKFLLKHLTTVAHYSAENRMPASNLAIIWGPCILYSSTMHPTEIARLNTLTKVLIENYDAIFADDERLVN